MPSGFLATLPTDVLLDAGVLQVGGTIVGVTRGGLTGSLEEEYQNIDFDGKRSDVEGLDRKVAIVARIAGTFLQFGTTDIARFEREESTGVRTQITAAITTAVAVAFTYTPGDSLAGATISRASVASWVNQGDLFGVGRYLTDLRFVLRRGNSATGLCTLVFAQALCTKWTAKGQDKDAVEIAGEFEARLDLTNSTDTDVLPYTVEVKA
jgi:hypothetical protein